MIKTSTNKKCLSGCEEKETLPQGWWEDKVEKSKEVLEKLNEFTYKTKRDSQTQRLRKKTQA